MQYINNYYQPKSIDEFIQRKIPDARVVKIKKPDSIYFTVKNKVDKTLIAFTLQDHIGCCALTIMTGFESYQKGCGRIGLELIDFIVKKIGGSGVTCSTTNQHPRMNALLEKNGWVPHPVQIPNRRTGNSVIYWVKHLK